MNPDGSSYAGGWQDGKQHGYGAIRNSSNVHKFGLYRQGTKILKLSAEQASMIQSEELDLQGTNQIQLSLGDEKQVFWAEISVLTNKFEPFDTLLTEEAKFELNRCAHDDKSQSLK